jgi:hypothetical protein
MATDTGINADLGAVRLYKGAVMDISKWQRVNPVYLAGFLFGLIMGMPKLIRLLVAPGVVTLWAVVARIKYADRTNTMLINTCIVAVIVLAVVLVGSLALEVFKYARMDMPPHHVEEGKFHVDENIKLTASPSTSKEVMIHMRHCRLDSTYFQHGDKVEATFSLKGGNDGSATIECPIVMPPEWDGKALAVSNTTYTNDKSPDGEIRLNWVGRCFAYDPNANGLPLHHKTAEYPPHDQEGMMQIKVGNAEHGDIVISETVGSIPLSGCEIEGSRLLWLKASLDVEKTTVSRQENYHFSYFGVQYDEANPVSYGNIMYDNVKCDNAINSFCVDQNVSGNVYDSSNAVFNNNYFLQYGQHTVIYDENNRPVYIAGTDENGPFVREIK